MSNQHTPWPEWKHVSKRYAVENKVAVAEFIPFDEMPESFDRAEARAKRAIDCYNACAGMANPAEEVRAMREALKWISERECADACVNEGEKSCTEFEKWTIDMYCPSCLARHTLKGKAI